MTTRIPRINTPLPKTQLSPIHLAVAALLAAGGAAHAQSAHSAAASAASAASQGADSVSTTLDVVTVTATKRSTSLQRTPVAVTSLSAADLDKQHVQTIQDVVHLVPSFQATTQGDHGVITMTLRGIGNDSAKTEYADPEVALFVDGIYSPRAEGASALLFDMQSIEVLRGPQGTLWGRNSTVGAVNMQTAKAVLGEKSGNLEGGLGDYRRFGTRGAFNLPLGDNAALRFAFVHEQHDGYVDYQAPPNIPLASQQAAAAPVISAYNTAHPANPIAFQAINPNLYVQNGPKYNAQDQTAARISLLWKPLSDMTWNVSYEQFIDRGTPNENLMQDPRPGEKFWSALIQVAPYVHRNVDTVRSRVDYALNDSMNLAYVAGYSHYVGSSDFDQAAGAVLPTSFTTGGGYQEDRTNYSRYNNYSHELELQSSGSHEIDWLLGVYYAAEDNKIRFDIPIFNGTQQGTVSWQGSFIQPKETVRSAAGFGQLTWNATSQWHLTGGLRYTHDKRENIGGTNNGWTGDPTVPQVPLTVNSDPLTSGLSTYQHNDGQYTKGKTTYLARASYDVTPDFLAYGSVSSGYKSGGLQDGGRQYGAETLTNYEAGTKNTLLGGKLRFNNALYYQDFKDFQFSAPVTNPDGSHGLATSNAEGAKVYGFESELAAKITADDKVQVSAAYTHTRLGHLIAGSNDYASLPVCTIPGISNCLDVTGHTMPHAPKFAGQVLYEHYVALPSGDTLTPRVSFHYESSSWLSVFNLGDGDRQKSYTRTDLGLRYANRKDWYVDAYIRNLEDGKIKTNAADTSGGIFTSQYLPPRTFGFNAGIDF